MVNMELSKIADGLFNKSFFVKNFFFVREIASKSLIFIHCLEKLLLFHNYSLKPVYQSRKIIDYCILIVERISNLHTVLLYMKIV